MIVNQYRMKMQMEAMQQRLVQRHGELTVETSATPFGCCNYFDRCTDELMSLHFGGTLPLLDWIGFEVSDVCVKTFEFMTYLRADRTEQGAASAGYLSDPCATPNTWEFGTCKLTIEDFGRYGRRGKTREVMKPAKYCITEPRRRLDGSVVTDEREWDLRWTTDQIINDISRDIIVGNSSNPGQMDGLETLVSTGYDCAPLDSIVIDWNGNPMSGGAGVTWNGAAVAATYDFVDVLNAVIRRIKQRISMAPSLRNQALNLGDMILVMPTNVAQCLLDFYTCWSVCAGAQYNEVSLQTYEARTFRNSLMGGLFGFGQITIDGIPIPIMGYDWGLIKGPKTADIYLLTGQVGSMKMWGAEHLSAQTAAATYGNAGYFSTDGGRILGLYTNDNECIQLREWMHPRLYTIAPWAQVRFQNVQCEQPGGFMSIDPEESSFFYQSSFTPAVCP